MGHLLFVMAQWYEEKMSMLQDLFKILVQNRHTRQNRIFCFDQNYRTISEQLTSTTLCPVQCRPVQDRENQA